MDPDGYLLRFAEDLREKECPRYISSCILKEFKLKNGQTLVLRKPIVEDAKMIVEYLYTVGGESDNLLFGKDESYFTAEMEIEHIKNINESETSSMVLGIINNNIVSIAQISSPNRKRIAHNSEVAISVKKDYWKNGIGSCIMEELIKSVKDGGIIKNISLGVKASNKNAIAMYEKFGFEKIGKHKDFFNINGDFDDEILMDLYI
ncbi:GNAT family N-acetyltransferase [Clostridium frigoris]|uniref:GNAT family N-acetyltransferase n=2 Tax=Clostridium frigoris TaxID=205327 RepID=A0ABS6BQ91_9CLOT|nr:GNAT family N-acetyltransferase [Clostridium frigoris]